MADRTYTHLLFLLLHLLPAFAHKSRANLTVYSSDTVPKVTPDSVENEENYTAPYFPLLGFKQYPGNPILGPNPRANWESAYLYNPAAIVIDDKSLALISSTKRELSFYHWHCLVDGRIQLHSIHPAGTSTDGTVRGTWCRRPKNRARQ